MKIIIPDVYMNFFNQNKQRFFDDGVLYDYDEILERYETLEFAEYAPDYIPIGNDNGDNELVMKAEKEMLNFGVIDQGAIGSVEPEYCQDFMQWYEKGADFDFDSSNKNLNSKVIIFIKDLPSDNKGKILLQIKKVFALDLTTAELLKIADNIPYTISTDYYKLQAEMIIEKNNLKKWLAIK